MSRVGCMTQSTEGSICNVPTSPLQQSGNEERERSVVHSGATGYSKHTRELCKAQYVLYSQVLVEQITLVGQIAIQRIVNLAIPSREKDGNCSWISEVIIVALSPLIRVRVS